MKRCLWVAVFLLAGCASSGVRITEAQLSSFESGKTTRDEVIQALGTPSSATNLPDGTSMLVYAHSQVKTRPETFIPIVGAFVGGADAYTNTVTLRFGADGKLLDKTSSDGASGAGLGLASGAPRPRE